MSVCWDVPAEVNVSTIASRIPPLDHQPSPRNDLELHLNLVIIATMKLSFSNFMVRSTPVSGFGNTEVVVTCADESEETSHGKTCCYAFDASIGRRETFPRGAKVLYAAIQQPSITKAGRMDRTINHHNQPDSDRMEQLVNLACDAVARHRLGSPFFTAA